MPPPWFKRSAIFEQIARRPGEATQPGDHQHCACSLPLSASPPTGRDLGSPVEYAHGSDRQKGAFYDPHRSDPSGFAREKSLFYNCRAFRSALGRRRAKQSDEFALDFGISAIYSRASASLKLHQVSALRIACRNYCGSDLRFSPQSNAISPCKRKEFPWQTPDAPVAHLA